MSVVLRAISVPDAAAIAAIDGRLRLVRPPFTLGSSAELSDADIEEALNRNYESANREFTSYRDLVAFVRQTHEEWAAKMGLPLGGNVSAAEFISNVDVTIVRDVLQRIQTDLMPAGLYEQAEELLLAIIGSKDLKEQEDVQQHARSLLNQCITHRHPVKASRKFADKRFKTLQDDKSKCKVQQIKEKIRERHCILETRATV
jgi:hypothetical protein